jgi:serine/threonine-protein kinase
VLVTKYGEVKIVDFGLAKASSQLEKSEPGIIKGKFSYLSPEAVMGQEVDSRADIFAVGIILWELLASRRLFFGDTDLQTVRQVEAAQVPPISQINRKVSPELERIVNKALTRDPQQRYQTARELGQALSKFLFTFAQPVSGYDIATIVQGTMRDKQKVHAPGGSIIDQLIEEALFEITSLKDDDAPASANLKAAAPLNADAFQDPHNWANAIASGERTPGYEQGNLSALEDGDPMSLSGRTVLPGGNRHPPPPTGVPGHLPPVSPRGLSRERPPNGKTGGHGLLIGIILFLVVAAAASAAWFTGIIPHP